ncbi:DUF6783 domain-containing protein [Enterocloster hominis (ex Hitch et al. 2024)]|uniref:DUF6783 domain-containing protein n=2 Tax=Enterocloster hominis (ex Hitch et al. 2024) TaxID=1917870 RepID=UPI003B50E52D
MTSVMKTMEMALRMMRTGMEEMKMKKMMGTVMRTMTRACLKIHSRHLHVPLRGIFGPDSVNVARYAFLIGTKSPTKWDVHLTESNFQTRPCAPSCKKANTWKEERNGTIRCPD